MFPRFWCIVPRKIWQPCSQPATAPTSGSRPWRPTRCESKFHLKTVLPAVSPIEILILERACLRCSCKHFGRKKPCKKSAALHPRQGNLLERNIFTGLLELLFLWHRYVPYPGGGEKWGGNGVGDDLYSFGFDGAYLWTGGRSTLVIPSVNVPYVKKGDSIGVALDLVSILWNFISDENFYIRIMIEI
jgi:hypothetical protein